MHPRNFGSDKIIRTYVSKYVQPFHVKGFEMSHILAWSPEATIYWTSMPCHSQLTAFKGIH